MLTTNHKPSTVLYNITKTAVNTRKMHSPQTANCKQHAKIAVYFINIISPSWICSIP